MSSSGFVKTFDRYGDDAAPPAGTPAARGVWALRVTKFDAGAKIGSSSDNLRTLRALGHYRRKPGKGVEPFEVYVSGNIAFEYVTDAAEFDIFDGALSPQSSTDIGANQVVVGPDAPGTTQVGNPVLVAGRETATGFVRTLNTDAGGRPNAIVVSSAGIPIGATPGGASPTAALQVGGTDGANLRALLVDVNGAPLVDGANSARKTYLIGPNGGTFPLTALAAAAFSGIYVIEAPAGTPLRIRRIVIEQISQTQTAAGYVLLRLYGTTATSTGGTVDTATVAALDPGDGAFAGVARRAPTGLTFNANMPLDEFPIWIPAAIAQVTGPLVDRDYDKPGRKPLVIPAGIANGVFLQQITAAAGAAGALSIKFWVTAA